MGQVGLRLCLLLRDCGVAVVAVDDHEDGENVGKAREAGLPVVIGRGSVICLEEHTHLVHDDGMVEAAAITAST